MIKQLRERAATYGTQTLTDIELAALLGYRPKPNETLAESTFLKNVHELSNRFRNDYDKRAKVTNSRDLFRYITNNINPHHQDVEQFYVIAMSRRNHVMGHSLVSIGGVAGTVVDPKVVFKKVMEFPRACAFALTHNHPSGSTEPSKEDIEITKKLKEGGKLLDLYFVDHIITGHNLYNDYHSLTDEGNI